MSRRGHSPGARNRHSDLPLGTRPGRAAAQARPTLASTPATTHPSNVLAVCFGHVEVAPGRPSSITPSLPVVLNMQGSFTPRLASRAARTPADYCCFGRGGRRMQGVHGTCARSVVLDASPSPDRRGTGRPTRRPLCSPTPHDGRLKPHASGLRVCSAMAWHYGVNTGFRVVLPPAHRAGRPAGPSAQPHRSHAAGVGSPCGPTSSAA